MKKSINVVGAVIVADSKVLCAQRGATGQLAGLWEFPGGKVERDETPKQALEREISEELRCCVEVGDEVTTTRHEYDFAIINLTTYWCQLIEGTPRMTEHSEFLWLSADELRTLQWAPADIPAVTLIQDALQ